VPVTVSSCDETWILPQDADYIRAAGSGSSNDQTYQKVFVVRGGPIFRVGFRVP